MEGYSYNEITMHGNEATELNGLIRDDAVCIGLEFVNDWTKRVHLQV